MVANSSDVPMLSLLVKNIVYHMCVGLMGCDQGGGFKGWARGGVGPALCKMRQLTCSMGLALRGIHIHVSKATTPNKDFTFENLFFNYPILSNNV